MTYKSSVKAFVKAVLVLFESLHPRVA